MKEILDGNLRGIDSKTYRQKLQDLVYEHHGHAQQQDSLPFDPVEWCNREHRLPTSRQPGEQLVNGTTHGEERNV